VGNCPCAWKYVQGEGAFARESDRTAKGFLSSVQANQIRNNNVVVVVVLALYEGMTAPDLHRKITHVCSKTARTAADKRQDSDSN